jgi:DNA-binding NtrC family response regulator
MDIANKTRGDNQNARDVATGRILVVDDHPRARESIAATLRHCGHEVEGRGSAIEALADLEQTAPDLVVTDLQMPGMDGLEFIRRLVRRRRDCRVVMITAHASVATAVEAMRCGAFDYIEKPFDPEALERVVVRALQHGDQNGPRSTVANDDGALMIGRSPAMTRLRRQIAQAGLSDETVLVTGESGSGKELVARGLHAASLRRDAAFVAVNCAALSPTLMESELFGHERGAFTNADAPRVGRFELAERGTLFLDEVAEIDMSLQAKLLRVIQERVFERVGSNDSRKANVRIIAATNRQLTEDVRQGKFRSDFFFRLNVLPICVPPLRDRREDVPELFAHFAALAAARLGRTPLSPDAAAIQLMIDYAWPGNVREFENLVTRLSVVTDGDSIGPEDIRPALLEGTPSSIDATEPNVASSSPGATPTRLEDMERSLIEATLEKFGGLREPTAKALGIGVRTLANKLKQYGYAPRTKVFSPRNVA